MAKLGFSKNTEKTEIEAAHEATLTLSATWNEAAVSDFSLGIYQVAKVWILITRILRTNITTNSPWEKHLSL